MITFPNCKINLGLNILARRQDGFHDLETFFFPINFYDVLEILPSNGSKSQLIVSGISAGEVEDNICLKAYHLIKSDYPQLPQVNVHLHKVIPIGAGLGGGSADAVFTLRLINKKFNLNIPAPQLFGYALQLGSDCPFFLQNRPCLATGRGEILEPVDITLQGYSIVIINPGINVNTAEAFKDIIPFIPSKNIKEIIKQPVATWKEELVNDFEKPIFKKHALLKTIKEKLYESGAVYASMSGSGSTIFGIFNKSIFIDPSIYSGYFYKRIEVT